MRVGIYDPYLDDLGGGEKYMLTIAECLSKQHHITIFWDNKKDLDELRIRFSIDLPHIIVSKNIFSARVSIFERAFETGKYDAIIFLSDGSIPLVLSRKLFIHIQQPLKKIAASSLLDTFKLKRISQVFYNSKYTQFFNQKKLSGVKTSVIYPPVQIHAKHTKKENIILHVGRFRTKNVGIDDYKKQGFMIEAFKKMHDQEKTGWKFIIAASVKENDEQAFSLLQKSAKRYPVEFLINKTNTQLWDIYNKAKIYWHASGFGEDLEKHPEFAEHFGISTVEAMGAGAVPVVINAGGQKEIVEDHKNGFLWNTLDELIDRTKRLITDTTLWEKMSKQARLRAMDFTKERFCEEVHKLLE